MSALAELMRHQTAGDPQSGRKWKRKSLRQLCRELEKKHHSLSPHTVGRLLRAQGYSLHVNYKTLDTRASPQRNEQFEYLYGEIESFLDHGWPVISVDTKKRELIGAFRNPGRVWCQHPTPVQIYDFRTLSRGVAIPYGIYDLARNLGYIYVGTSADTSEFAVDAIRWWWTAYGSVAYAAAHPLLILADGGGSNGYRNHLWKFALQHRLADRTGLAITVAHYPTGASKWNPADHRLFSAISCNWAGEPLHSYEKMLALLRGTTSETGLQVRAALTHRIYATQIKISEEQMAALNFHEHDLLPKWNYTIKPLLQNR